MAKYTFSCTIFLVLLSIFALFLFQVNGEEIKNRKKKAIANVQTNKQVKDIATSCVDQYNMKQKEKKVDNETLIFNKVVDAAKEEVSGSTKYYLKIDVTDSNKDNQIFSVVLNANPEANKAEKIISYILAPASNVDTFDSKSAG